MKKDIFGKIIIACILLISITQSFTIMNQKVQAATIYSAIVKDKNSPVRLEGSSKTKKLGTLQKGDTVVVYNKAKNGWCQILYKNRNAYIYQKHLSHFTTLSIGIVKAKSIDVRTVASNKGKKLGTLKKDTKVTVYRMSKSGWSEIRYRNKKAYVLTKNLTFSSEKTKKPAAPLKPKPPTSVKPNTTTPIKTKPSTPIVSVPSKPETNKVPFSFISHRGASGLYPEHTIEAYDEAIRLKTDYIELDLRMTKDGQFIVMHDETLDRTTNGTGKVSDHTLKEIKQLDAGIKFYKKSTNLKVPTLEELFQTYGNNVEYYIETKDSANDLEGTYEKKLLDIVSSNKINTKNIVFQSFSLNSLEKLHSLDKSLKLVQLFSFKDKKQITKSMFDRIATIGYGVGINYQIVDESLVKFIRDKKLEFHVWTVNRPEDMNRLIGYGVTGIFTDYPNILQNVLVQKGMR